jgi:hypothetical protein
MSRGGGAQLKIGQQIQEGLSINLYLAELGKISNNLTNQQWVYQVTLSIVDYW